MIDLIRRFQVGRFRGFTVLDVLPDSLQVPADMFFGNAPPGVLDQALRDHGMSDGLLDGTVTGLFLDTGSRKIVIDTGYGVAGHPSGLFAAHLAQQGVDFGTVDTVILTHWHTDHTGGLVTSEGEVTFPNAVHYMSRAEWDWTWSEQAWPYMQPLDGAHGRECLNAIRDQVVLLDGEQEIRPGVQVIPAPGHTPGHIAVELYSDGEQLLCVGDAAIHPLHLEHPDWIAPFETDAGQTVASRTKLFDRAAAERCLVYVTHFEPHGLGRVFAQEAGWQWEPVPVPVAEAL